MAIKRITIGLQDEQHQKIDELRVKLRNPDVDNEFVAGLLLNTLLRDEPGIVEFAEQLLAPFSKSKS